MQTASRFIALDIHKEYFVALGVNAKHETVYGPQRVANHELENWVGKVLGAGDAVVLEMTTNTYAFYDVLVPHVHSVTVVHPPHVALITRAQVKTDRKAASTLAKLHAAGLLTGVWIPPQEVRELRALVAQRGKMVRLATIAKNRLRAALHRHHLLPPEGSQPFHPRHTEHWLNLPVSALEQMNIRCDWETLQFAKRQQAMLEDCIKKVAAEDERVPLLIQLPGIGLLSAITLLAAIGEIERFPSDKKLVGYAGMGARVYDSGQTYRTGRITKAGRKDIRATMVEAAHHAARHHPYWKAEFERLAPRIGKSKAYVAIGRKLLVAVWHVLTKGEADRFADPAKVAASLFAHAYRVGLKNLPAEMSARAYIRLHLDNLHLGRDLHSINWGRKRVTLPPSSLPDL
jgi:transposase